MPNYMEIPNNILLELVTKALPYSDQIVYVDLTGFDSIRFEWMGNKYRVSHSLWVEEVKEEGTLQQTSNALLMMSLLDLAKEKLDRIDLTSPDDKQWHIECQVLETDRLRAEAELALADKVKALAESERMMSETKLIEATATHGVNVISTLKVSCGYCSAEFAYSGSDENGMQIMHDRFVDEHGYCRP